MKISYNLQSTEQIHIKFKLRQIYLPSQKIVKPDGNRNFGS